MATNQDTAAEILAVYTAANSEGICFMSYAELAKRIGRPGQQRILGGALDVLREECAARNLPDLASVIVTQDSMLAGTVLPGPNAIQKYGGLSALRSAQATVIAFDWSKVVVS